MNELIEALERAEVGSREMDGEIWWLVDRPAAGCMFRNAATGLPGPLPDKIPPGLGRLAVQNNAPAFTTSLDAALTLVPEGWTLVIARPGHNHGVLVAQWRAEIPRPISSGGGPPWIAFAPTPALALVIAALRARQAQPDEA